MKRYFLKFVVDASSLFVTLYSDTGVDISEHLEVSGNRAFGIVVEFLGLNFKVKAFQIEKVLNEGGYIKLEAGKSPRYSQEITTSSNTGPDSIQFNIDDILVEPDLLKDYVYPPEVFEMHTGTEIDEFISWPNPGWPKAGQFVIAGGEGSGKTSNMINLVLQLKKSDPTLQIAMASWEMDPLKVQATVGKYYPDLYTEIDFFFPQKYELAEVPLSLAFEKFLTKGYDYIIIDSVKEMFQAVSDELNLSGNKILNWYKRIMIRHNNAENNSKKFTTFLNIQQLNNDGSTTGGSRLRYIVDTVLLIVSDKERPDQKFLIFEKNRFGRNKDRLYFSMTGRGVNYEMADYRSTLGVKHILQERGKHLDLGMDDFLQELAEESMQEQMEKVIKR